MPLMSTGLKLPGMFKDGAGYDSQKLLNSVRGRYGQY
jgi:hypothetical protein